MIPWAIDYTRYVIAAILFVAAVAKVDGHRTLAAIIANYQLVPAWASAPIARMLPAAELLIAGALLVQVTLNAAAAAAAALFLIFAAAIAVNLVRGRSHIACGCFGEKAHSPLRWSYVARNVTLAGGALVTLPVLWPPRLVATLPASEHLSAAAAAAITMVCWWLVATLRRSVRQLSIERGSLDAVVPRS